MTARPFHFKRFSLFHHQSTMKVGTDAILLGAWIPLKSVKTGLDIGTGCGILGLMLSQRAVPKLDAVELDELSAAEAKYNFNSSQWHDQLQVYCMDIRRFADEFPTKRYDLIVSNPPFFVNSFKSVQQRKNQARHTDSLSFEELTTVVKKLLNPTGTFAVVLPFKESLDFVETAESIGLYVNARQLIIPVEGRPANRINLLFSLNPVGEIQSENFTIRNAQGDFADQYKLALKDFYLGL
ncbi:MAG: methyltransferase [Sulfurospirillum cavolei]|nr:methyltransferase [Sulfurospirillum cavolei]